MKSKCVLVILTTAFLFLKVMPYMDLTNSDSVIFKFSYCYFAYLYYFWSSSFLNDLIEFRSSEDKPLKIVYF